MKNKKKYAAWGLIFCLAASLLSGCKNTKIVLTTGLASNELFRIGDVSCRLPEALIYLLNQKNQYEEVYGIEMWEHAFGNTTMEEYLKNQVVAELAQVKSMVLLAEEQEIILSEEEKQKAQEAAAAYFGSMGKEEVEALNVSQEEIEKMYEDYCLAYKTYDQITSDVSVEISLDEARIIQLQQIFVQEEGLAKEIQGKLEAGEEFATLAANYSKASQMTISVARGEKEEAYETAAFDLDNEEISDIVAADDGYYILKCLSTCMEEESEANKIQVAQQQKKERFQGIYSDLMKDTLSEFQTKLWEEVRFADYEEVKTCSFFETYGNYFDK